ncbi:MAG: NADPH:quinone oxidoreductase family protein [Alphaproteobacteria bacterium]|nr:NADPH:quinone oxidoreductase family protein [Alphaproteobacteria bacterium]
MRLIEAENLDSIDSYRMVERDTPVPGRGQALIRVKACGVGYVDALVALGKYQVKPPLPHTPGMEIAGVIEALGEDTGALKVGQRVLAQAPGGFAEAAVVAPALIVPIPDRMSFAQAAAFRVNYLTALHGLQDRARLAPGETLLVTGAAGGVGLAAVQLGALMGARVIACASTGEKRVFARSHGATEVIDTALEGWRDRLKALTGGKGPNVIFDPVCGPLFEPAFRSVAWGGRHLVVGFAGGPIPSLPANLTLMKGAGLLGVDVRQFMMFEWQRAAAHVATLLSWVEEGRLVPVPGRVFAFDDYRDALGFALSGKGMGKTILEIG